MAKVGHEQAFAPRQLETMSTPTDPSNTLSSLNFTAVRRCLNGWLLTILALVVHPLAHADVLSNVLGLGGDSGQLAKLEFRLRENFPVTSVAWSPDGRYIATASTHGNLIHIWDVRQRQMIQEITLAASQSFPHGLAWSPDGHYLSTCGGDSSLRIYESHAWSLAKQIGAFGAGICQMQAVFSSDGKQVAVLGSKLRVYDPQDWHLIKTLDLGNSWGRGHLLNAIAYVSGTHTLLIGGGQFVNIGAPAKRDAHIAGMLWFLEPDETVPGRSVPVYRPAASDGGGADVLSLALSPDGTRVATGVKTGEGIPSMFVDESVHIVSLSDGKLLGAPLDKRAFGGQYGLSYTADGRFLLVGHEDPQTKAIHVIDAKTLQVVDTVHGVSDVFDLSGDPTGRYFAAGTGNQVLVWSLPATDTR